MRRILSYSLKLATKSQVLCSSPHSELLYCRYLCRNVDIGVTQLETPVNETIISPDIKKVCSEISNCLAHRNCGLEKSLNQLGLTLTTNLVLGVLRKYQSEEKLAFRFFIWAGHQEHYAHEAVAYNEMIDILSNTTYKVKQFRIVCDMLDYMKRSNKQIVPVTVLIEILRQYASKYLTHLRKFSKKKQMKVQKHPETHAFNLLLDGLCKCCLVEDAESLFFKVRESVRPNANTYNILFFGWCRVRNPARAMMLLEEMIKLGFPPDSFAYNTAIESFCKGGMPDEAAKLFEFMKTKGSATSSPDAKTYSIMILHMLQNERAEEASKILASMVESGCLPDVSTYRELIEGMCMAGKIDESFKFLEEMKFRGYPFDIVTYNCFIRVLCEKRRTDEAVRFYNRMLEMGCYPSVQTFTMLIKMFYDVGDVDGATEAWKEMEMRECRADVDSYFVMVEGLFGCGRKEEACLLIDEVMRKGMKLPYRVYEAFLNHLSKDGNLRGIHRLSQHVNNFYNHSMARRLASNEKRKRLAFRRR